MKQIAILASGNGSNAEAIVHYFRSTKEAEVALILTNKREAGVVERAERLGIPCHYSKATNVSSTYYALRTMTTPYVLILGGEDKGNDYMDITDLITAGARGLVFLTTDVLKLYKSFHGKVPQIASALSMEEAIEHARQMAQPGDTVLLSPACASFDLFQSYIHRGDCFREVVQSLIQDEEKHV